ncbi:transposase domain-containing protein [Mycobacterium servetii]|uniref:Transposase domain-containing protein n=1 Tax=Mycobacterium servetii TaxID=3237418 RepID=A0ABV4C0G4_9MYCO
MPVGQRNSRYRWIVRPKTPSHLGVPLSVQSVICPAAPGQQGPFAPGHLGELTRIVSFDLVDAALENTGGMQRRVRVLPSRVVVYLLLAAALFAEIGYQQVWARLVAGLDPATVATPGSSALSQALRRVGVAPLRELFTLLRGPAVGAARWHGLLVCAIDGTSMFVPNCHLPRGWDHRLASNYGPPVWLIGDDRWSSGWCQLRASDGVGRTGLR